MSSGFLPAGIEPSAICAGSAAANAVYLGSTKLWSASQEDPIPLTGTLTNKFIFSTENPNPFIDVIGGVNCRTKSSSDNTIHEDGVNIGETNGINLNVQRDLNDYIECIFKIYPFSGTESYHIRPLNLAGQNDDITHTAALIIRRGASYNYWASYISGWGSSFSTDYNFFNEKKLGIFLKEGGLLDIYIDNTLAVKNYSANWSNTSYKFYGIGTNVNMVTSPTILRCSRVRIFKNCK